MDGFLVGHGGLAWKTVVLGTVVVASCSAWWSWHPCDHSAANEVGRSKLLIAMAARTVFGMLVMVFALWMTRSTAPNGEVLDWSFLP